MNTSDIIKQVLDFLERTGTALHQTGFNASVKYVIANAIGDLIGAGISLVIFIFCLVYFLRAMKRHDLDRTLENSSEFWCKTVLSVIAGGVSFISMATFSPVHAIKVLISPEWYAILELINLVK